MSYTGQSLSLTETRPRMTVPLALALAALVLGIGAWAARGFDANGLRLGTQMIWRLGGLVLFAAIVLRPLSQFVTPLRRLADSGRMLLQGFCAVLGVFFAFLLVPNIFAIPDGVEQRGVTAGMTLFILFTGAITLVLAAALSARFCRQVGDRACRVMLGLAVGYFWLCHVLIALTRLSGQGDAKLFHQMILMLLLGAACARLAGRFYPRPHGPA